MTLPSFSDAVLALCAFWALAGPLLSPEIARRAHWLLFGLGAAAVTASGAWSAGVAAQALLGPLGACGAALIGVLLVSFCADWLGRAARRAEAALGARAACALAVAFSAAVAAGLSAFAGALALVELLRALRLQNASRSAAAVLGCSAIGIVSTLSPFGGPLPAAALARLSEAPYEIGPLYLAGLLGPWAVSGLFALSAAAAAVARAGGEPAAAPELSAWDAIAASGRLYVLLGGLILLGKGLAAALEASLLGAPPPLLYWAGAAAVWLDGPTLATLMIGPYLSQEQLRHALLGLAISGGALASGTPQNLVVARQLEIPGRAWALVGLPVALALTVFCALSL